MHMESLSRVLAVNSKLRKPLEADQEGYIQVPSKYAFSLFTKLLQPMECEQGAMCALFGRNRDRIDGDVSGFWNQLEV